MGSVGEGRRGDGMSVDFGVMEREREMEVWGGGRTRSFTTKFLARF